MARHGQQPDGDRSGCNFTIREEQPGDADAIGIVVEAAVSSAPVAQLVDAIRRSSGFIPGLSLVATVQSCIVGHVMGSPAFYGRLGFEHAVPYGIHIALPSWAPAEAAQVLRLSSYRSKIRGDVAYPPAYDVVAEN